MIKGFMDGTNCKSGAVVLMLRISGRTGGDLFFLESECIRTIFEV